MTKPAAGSRAVALEIPASLYDKAQNQNDQLTDLERDLLRSRGDLVGRALADPDALTLDEAYRTMLWPAPDVVRAKVRRVTDGRVDGPAELFSEAKTGRILTVSECGLLLGRFFSGEMPGWMGELVYANPPGTYEAADLVFARRFYPEGMQALLAPSLVDKDMSAVAMAAVHPLGKPTLTNLGSCFSNPPNNPN